MDWDELEPKKHLNISVGDDLTSLSLDELSACIEALGEEVTRIKAEITRKETTRNAARGIFKS